MPKRSTPFQAIVRLVRQHYARPGVTVTESKMLLDAVRGIEREVDIVIEGELDGEPMTISVEVIEHGRRASVTWVDEMLRKHRDLPTNLLLLVSKSGFTSSAVAAIAAEAGRVQALTPEVIELEGQVIVKHFFVDTMRYVQTGCKLHVRDGGEQVVVVGEPATDVYDSTGRLLGPLSYLVQDAMGLDAVRLGLSFEAHNHPDKDQVRGFSVGIPIAPLGYCLQKSETGELHLIDELIITGDAAVSQTEVPLTLARLGGRVYGSAEAPIAGRPAVWVGTTDLEEQTTKISWQVTDAQNSDQAQFETRPMQFPGLRGLLPSPIPKPSVDEPPTSANGERSSD
ncbi:hypothetical protein OHA71_32830 [Streptomyces sp. NBC_00444]|uniref:hypothetical protein n=1 Tax=Streptomyces sp. NBC_00444 TaxID=2975744 RepID=UPI002E2238B1